MKKFYTAILLIIVSLHSRSQTCVAATAPNLVIKNPAYINGTGTGVGTVNAKYRFSNVTNITPATTDVIVTITAKVNAVLTNIDDDAANPGTANNFQPVVTVDANKTGYIEFDFSFVIAGTTTPFVQNCINFTAVDIDGQAGVQERVSVFAATSMALGNPTYLTTSLGGNLSTITSNNIGCNGICTNPENVCNFGKINSSNVVFQYGQVNVTGAAVARYGSFQFAPYAIPLTGVGPLPVNYIGLNAYAISNGVSINWNTNQELNVKHFEVEKSEDGIRFNTISTIAATNNSYGGTYSVTDNQPITANYYFYRIRSVDFDGKIKLSAVIKITFNNNIKGIQVFPSPINDNASILFTAMQNEKTTINIMDITGKVLQQYNVEAKKGTNLFPVINVADLRAGTYFIKISSVKGGTKTQSFLKL